MKLLRLKLYEPYRSLKFEEQKFPKLELIKDELDPICLVGLNGSGKSNLLQLLADIFYLLESDLLEYKTKPKPYIPYSDNKRKVNIYFELDYKIKIGGKEHFVRIIREPHKKKPTFFLYDSTFLKLEEQLIYGSNCLEYLPVVVAYTSGLNELLSMPFIELQDYYAREVTYQVLTAKNLEAKIMEPTMMLMDYDSNAAIVLSNYLLNDHKLSILESFTRIEKLSSFKIVIQLDRGYGNKQVHLPKEFEQIIDDLKHCATVFQHSEDAKRGDTYELDFLVTDVTKQLFKHYFKTPKQLFSALSKLNLLNTLCVQKTYRDTLRTKRSEGKLLRFPVVATLDKIFRIEEIELVLKSPKVRTEYLKISDGEHQFIHIVGGMLLYDEKDLGREVLYLLDEPDTHFNPEWRSEFFSKLDQILQNKNQEVILTTHSPFILGDCHGYNVFVFKRDVLTNEISFTRSSYETYGANFAFLLKNIFHFNFQISNKSRAHLEALETELTKANAEINRMTDKDIAEFETELKLYGESVEKLLLLNQLEQIKTSRENSKK